VYRKRRSVVVAIRDRRVVRYSVVSDRVLSPPPIATTVPPSWQLREKRVPRPVKIVYNYLFSLNPIAVDDMAHPVHGQDQRTPDGY